MVKFVIVTGKKQNFFESVLFTPTPIFVEQININIVGC